MNKQEEKQIINKVYRLTVRLAQSLGADKADAGSIARMLVVPNRGFSSASNAAGTVRIIVRDLPYNLALDILNRQDVKIQQYGEETFPLSDRQIAVVENFIDTLQKEIEGRELFARLDAETEAHKSKAEIEAAAFRVPSWDVILADMFAEMDAEAEAEGEWDWDELYAMADEPSSTEENNV